MDPARGWWTWWSNVRMEGIAEDEWLPTFWHWTSSQKWTQDENFVIDNKTDTIDLWFKGKQLNLQQQVYLAVDKYFSTWFLLPVYWTVIARGNAIMADFALCWVMLCLYLLSATPVPFVSWEMFVGEAVMWTLRSVGTSRVNWSGPTPLCLETIQKWLLCFCKLPAFSHAQLVGGLFDSSQKLQSI